MKLYFGNAAAAVTTIMLLALMGYIAACVVWRGSIRYWGRMSVILLVYGLVVCCFAAARDGLDKTIQNAIDGSCPAGSFPLVSVPNIIGCIGALVIIVSAIAVPIAHSQEARRVWFYIMSGGTMLKIVTMEISRIASALK